MAGAIGLPHDQRTTEGTAGLWAHLKCSESARAGRWTGWRKAFGRNAERLIKAKRHYDPDNVFCSAIPGQLQFLPAIST
jgi:hypothetical protein